MRDRIEREKCSLRGCWTVTGPRAHLKRRIGQNGPVQTWYPSTSITQDHHIWRAKTLSKYSPWSYTALLTITATLFSNFTQESHSSESRMFRAGLYRTTNPFHRSGKQSWQWLSINPYKIGRPTFPFSKRTIPTVDSKLFLDKKTQRIMEDNNVLSSIAIPIGCPVDSFMDKWPVLTDSMKTETNPSDGKRCGKSIQTRILHTCRDVLNTLFTVYVTPSRRLPSQTSPCTIWQDLRHWRAPLLVLVILLLTSRKVALVTFGEAHLFLALARLILALVARVVQT